MKEIYNSDEISNLKISVFKSVSQSNIAYSSNITLKEFITKKTDTLIENCTILRNEPKHSPIYDEIKRNYIPCATLSCVCEERKADKVLARNPIIVIDIDYDPDKNINAFLKDEFKKKTLIDYIFKLPCVYAVSKSCSGSGIYAIIVIDSNENDEDFLEHFLSLEKEFKNRNIVIDSACKDIVRLRLASMYDVMIKEGIISAYTGRVKKETETVKIIKNHINNRDTKFNQREFNEFKLQNVIDSMLDNGFNTCEYNNWINCIYYLKPFDTFGLDLAIEISRRSGGYKSDEDVEKKWNQIPDVHTKDEGYSHFFGLAINLLGYAKYEELKNEIYEKYRFKKKL